MTIIIIIEIVKTVYLFSWLGGFLSGEESIIDFGSHGSHRGSEVDLGGGGDNILLVHSSKGYAIQRVRACMYIGKGHKIHNSSMYIYT